MPTIDDVTLHELWQTQERLSRQQVLLERLLRSSAFTVAEKLSLEGPLAKKSEAGACNQRIGVQLDHCEKCREGELSAVLHTGQGFVLRKLLEHYDGVGQSFARLVLAPQIEQSVKLIGIRDVFLLAEIF